MFKKVGCADARPGRSPQKMKLAWQELVPCHLHVDRSGTLPEARHGDDEQGQQKGLL